ncbi:hypothetical protein GN156_29330, partial [bacterium LRH843]|nr:hypothetical protein [bacterium LRH843]
LVKARRKVYVNDLPAAISCKNVRPFMFADDLAVQIKNNGLSGSLHTVNGIIEDSF